VKSVLQTFRQARGERGAIATLLLLVLVLHFAALSGISQGSGHKCAHDSCPMRRPVKSAPMKCHGSSSETPARESCSIRAGCDCGGSHLPMLPHREIQGVLPSVVASLVPLPSNFLVLPGDGARSLPVREIDAPPPRLLPLA
jgi:hypothetical protein